jgi:hypothetical protein
MKPMKFSQISIAIRLVYQIWNAGILLAVGQKQDLHPQRNFMIGLGGYLSILQVFSSG